MSLTVVQRDLKLVVDSRLIASALGVDHSDWFQNVVKKYESQTEQAFGIIRFENGEIKGRGRREKFAYLTEDQSTFLMTLSRNTPEVIDCKIRLVRAFSEAKKLLLEPRPVQDAESLDNVVDDFLAIIREAFTFAGEQFLRIKEQSVSQQRKLLRAKLSDPEAIYEVALEALNKVDHTVTHQRSKLVNHNSSAIASIRERLLERLENTPALVVKYKELPEVKKRNPSGWIHGCLKKVSSTYYPLVDGERDPDNLEHWYWVYRWAEKSPQARRKNGHIYRRIQLRREMVKSVQFAIDCGANRERIVEQINKMKSKVMVEG